MTAWCYDKHFSIANSALPNMCNIKPFPHIDIIFKPLFITLFNIRVDRVCVLQYINHTFADYLHVRNLVQVKWGCNDAKIHQSFDVLWPVKISLRKYWANLLTEILSDDDGQRRTTFLSYQIWSSIIFLQAWGRSRFCSCLVTMAQ